MASALLVLSAIAQESIFQKAIVTNNTNPRPRSENAEIALN
jgi:hypothetical protein